MVTVFSGGDVPDAGVPISALTDDQSEPLTREERRLETAATMLALAGETCGRLRDELLEHVVRLNMVVARTIAGRYLNRGVDEDDLVQVAYLALTRAAQAFDPAKHQDFLAYAVPTIRGELKKHFRDVAWSVRPPRRVQETQAQVVRAAGELVQLFGREPTAEETADHLHATLRDVVEALAADGCFAPVSLDQPAAADDPRTLAERLRGDDHDEPSSEARMVLAPIVRDLSDRDRRIVYLRWFEERTQAEIAEDIGVSQMQVSRLLNRIMRDLRAATGSAPGA